jgi:hypothetical protein
VRLRKAALGRRRGAVEPIHVTYDVSAECPDAAAFTDQVFRRTRHARLAPADETARAFEVRIRTGKPVRGTLALRDVDGITATRNVSGNCFLGHCL